MTPILPSHFFDSNFSPKRSGSEVNWLKVEANGEWFESVQPGVVISNQSAPHNDAPPPPEAGPCEVVSGFRPARSLELCIASRRAFILHKSISCNISFHLISLSAGAAGAEASKLAARLAAAAEMGRAPIVRRVLITARARAQLYQLFVGSEN